MHFFKKLFVNSPPPKIFKRLRPRLKVRTDVHYKCISSIGDAGTVRFKINK